MISVVDLRMEFPGVIALDGVSVNFAPGEVHGLIGENGAGKSTLLNILSGILTPTSGTIRVDGKDVVFRSSKDAEAAGIAMIHQELNLVDTLNVAENIFLGVEPRKGFVLDRQSMRERAQAALTSIGSTISPDALTGDLPLAERQLVEIAKASGRGAKLVIMDEPTAVLTERETANLKTLIRALRERGVAIAYVSHRLDEVRELCDRITVLRDGKLVGEYQGLDEEGMAELMVGRPVSDLFPEKAPPPRGGGYEFKGLVEATLKGPIDLEISPGEIVGLGGLVGSGRTEVGEAIAGLRACNLPRTQRVAYVSEDRKAIGLHLTLPIDENVCLPTLRNPVMPKVIRSTAGKWKERLNIRASNLGVHVQTLSGGNQQKVALAKWLETDPQLLILDEPTRGVDIGAKAEIYRIIVDLAAQGKSILLISSEMPELIGLCHRVLVMRERKVVGELVGDEITENNLIRLAAGVTS